MAALSPAPESYIQSILDTDLYKLRSAPFPSPAAPRAAELTPLPPSLPIAACPSSLPPLLAPKRARPAS